jgi:hypothetical protein
MPIHRKIPTKMGFGRFAKSITVATICGVVLAACGSDGGDSEAERDSPKTGYFMDSAVSGLTYLRADGFTGITGNKGEFEFYFWDPIEFRIGNVSLGSAAVAQRVVFVTGQEPPPYYLTPADLTTGDAAKGGNAVVNKLIFLQTLDTDGDLDNGIQIPDVAHQVLLDQSVDFEASTRSFVKGAFLNVIDELNARGAFSKNRPRKIQSRFAALMHFGELNQNPGFPVHQRTFTTWWREQNGCGDIGKSRLATYGTLVEFCPNLNGLDGCYEGVTTDSGKVLLPKMKANDECTADENSTDADCLGYQQFVLEANLKIDDDGLTGNFEASCHDTLSDQVQPRDADFIDYDQYDAAESQLFNEIKEHANNGSCSVHSDCSLLELGADNIWDREPKLLAYSNLDIDEELLRFQKYKYDDIASGYRYYYSPGYGLVMTSLPTTRPEARCVTNVCEVVQVPISTLPSGFVLSGNQYGLHLVED